MDRNIASVAAGAAGFVAGTVVAGPVAGFAAATVAATGTRTLMSDSSHDDGRSGEHADAE